MEKEKFLDILQETVPLHLQDLKAALTLLSDELKYTQAAIDMALRNALECHDFEKIHKLADVSKDLSYYSESVLSLAESIQTDSVEINENECPEHTDRVNYEAYKTDESVAHDLFSSVTYTKPAAFSYKGKRIPVTTWGRMLTEVCKLLYREDEKIFLAFPFDESMQGRIKPRFSMDKSKLRAGVPIADSGVFIETNLNANEIRRTILAMLDKYGISSDSIRLFLSKDLTGLHEKK